ncbi:STAS domain-containing protein [Amycolatopsis sp. NPDC005232]|uniref:STAS domain-containing protein n=1 Tax=Amycolatopsis sp. NPDC005232 TaxID=3157027 RepID=UPI0033A4A448
MNTPPAGFPRPPFEAETYTDGLVTIVRVRGDVDLATAEEFDTALDSGLQASGPALVVDMSAVDFLGSSGIASLVLLRRRAARENTSVAIASGNRHVVRILDLLGLSEELTVHGDVASAVHAVTPAG